MLFTLEVLQAEYGDSLILHIGETAKKPQFIVIDGGPPGVYAASLRPRLVKIKNKWSPNDPLALEMVMVSHIDEDHVQGIVDLFGDLVDKRDNSQPLPFKPQRLWHNSFDDILNDSGKELFTRLNPAAHVGVDPASVNEPVIVFPAGFDSEVGSGPVFASVPQGRTLRNQAKRLNVTLNTPFQGLIMRDGKPVFVPVPNGGKMSFSILSPSRQRLEKLHDEWDKAVTKLKKAHKLDEASAAAYSDTSVYNLSSIVVLAEMGNKKMLLTGDARGDDVISGLQAAELLQAGGSFKVDILKLPHHGSDRNVSTAFFRTILADHYVISANGKFNNPDIATLEMILEARPDDQFTIHLTNGVGELGLKDKLDRFKAKADHVGRKFGWNVRKANEPSIKLDLDEPVTY